MLSARLIALQGLGAPYPLSPVAIAVQGLIAQITPEPELPPANDDQFNRPIIGGTWRPAPLPRRVLRRRRQQDILFLRP